MLLLLLLEGCSQGVASSCGKIREEEKHGTYHTAQQVHMKVEGCSSHWRLVTSGVYNSVINNVDYRGNIDCFVNRKHDIWTSPLRTCEGGGWGAAASCHAMGPNDSSTRNVGGKHQ